MYRNLALLACSVLVFGCSGDSPTEPPAPLVVEGELESLGALWFPVTLDSGGVLRVELVELTAVLVEVVGEVEPILVLGVGLGQVDGTDCPLSSSFSLEAGDSVSFGLSSGDYCVLVFDDGALPADATVRYVLSTEIS